MFQIKCIVLFIALIGLIEETTVEAIRKGWEVGKGGRSLKTIDTVGSFAEEWNSYQEICSNVLFSLSLFMSEHVYLIASALSGNGNNQNELCDSLQPVFHHNVQLGKDIFFLPADDSSMDSRLYLGDYELHELVQAFDETSEPSEEVPYDFVKNNCATFILEYVQALNIQFDSTALIQYAVDHLTSHQVNIQAMKESSHFSEILDGGIAAEDTTDEVLMQLLVTKYIAEHMI